MMHFWSDWSLTSFSSFLFFAFYISFLFTSSNAISTTTSFIYLFFGILTISMMGL